jgi:hypothetical protein
VTSKKRSPAKKATVTPTAKALGALSVVMPVDYGRLRIFILAAQTKAGKQRHQLKEKTSFHPSKAIKSDARRDYRSRKPCLRIAAEWAARRRRGFCVAPAL